MPVNDPSVVRWSLRLALIVGATQVAAIGQNLAPPGGPPPGIYVNVQPTIVPAGGVTWITVSNETLVNFDLPSPCPFHVTDPLFGAQIYAPACPGVLQTIAAGASYTVPWRLHDDFGVAVPAGTYLVTVQLGGSAVSGYVQVSAAAASGVAALGAFSQGHARTIAMTAPSEAGSTYVVAAAFGDAVGTVFCGGMIPLDLDPLLLFSTTPGNGVFFNTVGVLDANGETTAPFVLVPPLPPLPGGFVSIRIAGAILDPTSACPIRSVSSSEFALVL